MCFSAAVSFATGALLLPVALYAIKTTHKLNASYLPLALIPLFFALQQVTEGLIWHYSSQDDTESHLLFVQVYLFFSHFFWLVWIPLTAWRIETEAKKKKLFFNFMLTGFIIGGLAYVPLILQPERIEIFILKGSIYYDTRLITHPYISLAVLRTGYIILVLTPLFLSSEKLLRQFGWMVALAIPLTMLLFEYAFVSIWCFFAAILSLYLAWQLIRVSPQTKTPGRL